jgi:peptidoglycan hydrolase FlgJ
LAASLSTDIIMDVARAADPDKVSAARERLAAMAAGSADATQFASAADIPAARRADPGGRGETFERFEAFVLQSFVEHMLPKEVESVYGGGFAGDMWKSMMAEQLANQMAKAGGIGIADRILSEHFARRLEEPVTGSMSLEGARQDAETRNLASQAIVHEIQRRIGGTLGQNDQLLTERKQG